MIRAESAYRELLAAHRERTLLESCATVLEWDEETYLPGGGVELRSEQQALLARLLHERSSDPRMGELLATAEAGGFAADSIEAANLRELRREHDQATKLPPALVEELARTTTLAQEAWQRARAEGDPAGFVPLLDRMVGLVRAQADCVRGEHSRYTACLDDWEPGLTEARVVELFAALTPALVEIADRAATDAAPPAVPPLPIAVQRGLVTELALRCGFDLERGRIDEAVHPSTIRIGPGDVRLTTRYREAQPLAAVFTALHEIGHGVYDQNLPDEHFGAPVGEPPSLALHEAHARLFENRIGRSPAFGQWLGRRLGELAGAPIDPAALAREIDRVARTTTRIHADEVTYDLHIAVRVELERALVAGDLAAADLPEAWDAAYTHLIAPPPRPREGCLQDGHWASAMFGYFPTYTLGNLAGAQLHDAASAALPDLEARLGAGELADLGAWLHDRVHRHGGRYTAAELMMRATGGPIAVDAQLAHLRGKYGA